MKNRPLESRVTPDLRGCQGRPPGKKICIHPILKEKTVNYISLERLIMVDFGKNYELPFFF